MGKQLTMEILEELLPHGSGIDCKWLIEDKGSNLVARNSFHCMDTNGYYDGYQDFTLIIPKEAIGNFKLQFNGNQYKARKYYIREYLEGTVSNSLDSLIINLR